MLSFSKSPVFIFGYDPPRGNNPLNPRHTQVPRFQVSTDRPLAMKRHDSVLVTNFAKKSQQVGDFGLTVSSRALWRPVNGSALNQAKIRMAMWEQRTMAKPGWFLPVRNPASEFSN